jgi:tetratricopeptide (TPR) repeat protein
MAMYIGQGHSTKRRSVECPPQIDDAGHRISAIELRGMTSLFRFGRLLILVVTLAGCIKGRPVGVLPAPVVAPDRLHFQEGLRSLYEFTLEGYARAIDRFNQASALAPDNCEYRLHVAQAHLFLALEQKLNREDFRVTWDKGADPGCAPGSAFSLRLEAFRALDDFGIIRDRTALARINEAIELAPDDILNRYVLWKMKPDPLINEADLALIQYELGNYWLIRGDYIRGRRAFERALELSPRHFKSLIGLAQARSAIDEDTDVEPLYTRAVELAPNFLEGRILLGDYYSGIEENELARQQYMSALASNHEFEVAHLRLGISYLQSSELDNAQKAFLRTIEINPSSYEAYYYLGNIALLRGDLESARQQYEESLKFVLNFPDATYALGAVFFRQGKIDAAAEQFEKVLRLNRSHADAYFSRAAVRAQRGQFQEAVADYETAIAYYEIQRDAMTKAIAEYQDRGLARKAEAELVKMQRLENNLERARQLKMKIADASDADASRSQNHSDH